MQDINIKLTLFVRKTGQGRLKIINFDTGNSFSIYRHLGMYAVQETIYSSGGYYRKLKKAIADNLLLLL